MMNNTMLISGSQTTAVTIRDAAVQCTLLSEPLIQCNVPESREGNMEPTESESASEGEIASEGDIDYCDTEDYCSEGIERYC